MSTLGVNFDVSDETGTTEVVTGTDAILVGHFEKGPAMVPTLVTSVEQLENLFGARDTFSKIAAQNHLKNSGRVTVMRLIGVENADYPSAFPGWRLGVADANPATNPDGIIKAITFSGSVAGVLSAFLATNSLGGGLASSASADPDRIGMLAAVALYRDTNKFMFVTASLPNAAAILDMYPSVAGATSGWLSGSAGVGSIMAQGVYTALVPASEADGTGVSVSFSFDPAADNHISKVLNTDLRLLRQFGHALIYAPEHAWKEWNAYTASSPSWHVQAQNLSGTSNFTDYAKRASTPAVCSQLFGATPAVGALAFTTSPQGSVYPLFSFKAKSFGVYGNGIRVRISNIRKSFEVGYDYGKFDVSVYDASGKMLEKFSDLDIDPKSDRFVAKVIGDQELSFDNVSNQMIVSSGGYAGESQHIAISLATGSNGQTIETDPGTFAPKSALPWGFQPYKLWGNTFNVVGDVELGDTELRGLHLVPLVRRQYVSNSWTPSRAWGVRSTVFGSDNGSAGTKVANVRDDSLLGAWQYLGTTQGQLPEHTGSSVSRVRTAAGVGCYFTLHHLTGTAALTGSSHLSTLQIKNLAYNTARTRAPMLNVNAIEGTAAAQFELVLANGHDGWLSSLYDDLCDPSEFVGAGASGPTYTGSNTFMVYTSATPQANIHVATYRTALELIRSMNSAPELLMTPGCRADGINQAALDVCASRGDMFYPFDFGARNDTTVDLIASRKGSLNYNSNVGAAYCRWVQVTLPKGRVIWCPPVVAIAGIFAKNDKMKFAWYSPAGNTRGNLSEFGVKGVDLATKKTEIEQLRNVQLNPLVKNKGDVVVWGNSTLQQTLSALQQISVTRMVIDAKRFIGAVAQNLVFEPNNSSTWTTFEQKVSPYLEYLRQNNGVEKFKVVADASVNTPLKQKQGILVGKIVVQPTRTVAEVEIPFTLSDNAADF